MAVPFLDKLQNKAPGAPQAPKVPAGPPVLSTPRQTNPPSPAAGPVGRPPRPPLPFAGGAGAPLPVSPRAAVPAAPSTPATPAPRPAPSPAVPRPTTAPGTAAPQPGQIQPQIAGQLQVTLDHVPSSSELLGVAPGTQIQTPYGTVDSAGKLTFSPEGEQKYKEATVARRREFGFHPFNNDPNAPPPPARLGKPMFNPFTGQWVK